MSGLRTVGLLASLIALLCAAAGPASAESGDPIPNRYIVILEDYIEHPGEVGRAQAEAHNGRVGLVYRHALKGYSATLSARAAEALRSDPRVKSVVPDREVELAVQSTPTGVKRVFAAGNGNLSINETIDFSVNADVAVLDTGIDATTPDLTISNARNCVPAGENTTTEGKIKECVKVVATDGNGHGTHVAGTVGARDNAFGVVGVAPGARLWSVKVLNKAGFSTDSWIAAGVDWVTGEAASIEVANMSIQCKCTLAATETAIEGAVEGGVVVVVAAGNFASDASEFSPAKSEFALTVGSIADYDGIEGEKSKTPPCSLTHYEKLWGAEKDDTWGNESNWGGVVGIVAPGVCINSTLPEEKYGYMTGTSMATPHVAGAAAILAEHENPGNILDVLEIQETLLEEGNKNWTAEKEGPQQPLLDVSNEGVF